MTCGLALGCKAPSEFTDKKKKKKKKNTYCASQVNRGN